jgi:hypothetical protein
MSPLEGIWPLLHLKKICRRMLWFEAAFKTLVPESRRGNHYRKSKQTRQPKIPWQVSETVPRHDR